MRRKADTVTKEGRRGAPDHGLRHLGAKWLLAAALVHSAASALSPLQTVFAKGGPCEVVAMGVEAVADSLHRCTGWLLLQVDLKNAFNSIHRSAILNANKFGQPKGCNKVIHCSIQVFSKPFRWGGLHRWYLDDGVYMGSIPKAEEVLRALTTSLPALGPELNMCKTTFWGF